MDGERKLSKRLRPDVAHGERGADGRDSLISGRLEKNDEQWAERICGQPFAVR